MLPHERADGQPFLVDVVLHAEVREAGYTDDLASTVDYSEVAQVIVETIEGPPLNLIEAVAQRIADRILDLNRVSIVEVTVHKPQAPIDADFADVAVSIVRVR